MNDDTTEFAMNTFRNWIALSLVCVAVGCGEESPDTPAEDETSVTSASDEKADSNADADEADYEVSSYESTQPGGDDSDDAASTAADADTPSDANADEVDASTADSDATDAADASDEDASDDEATRPVDECTADECGPGLLAPNYFCDDGSMAGPVCVRDERGTCGWEIFECPTPAECTYAECGPGPRPPIVECADGSMGGPVCERDRTGTCVWDIRECPAECKPELCGDRPDWLQICDDGTELHPVCQTVPGDHGDTFAPVCQWTLPMCGADL